MGFINVAARNISEGAPTLRLAIESVTRGYADPILAEALATNAQAALSWLRAQGVRTIVGNWRPGSNAMLTPPAAIGAGLNWRGRGPDQALRRLARVLQHQGGLLCLGLRGRELIIKGGCCRGIVIETADGRQQIDASAVVIADGGFQANPELVGRWISPRPDRLVMRHAGTGRGDGLLMAIAANAATTDLEGFYGHVQSGDALTNPKLWPYPSVDMPISAGIVVNHCGQRLVDEGLGGIFVANAIARLDDPLDAIAVFDHDIWMTRACEFPLPSNPLLVSAGATLHARQTLRDLAECAGIAVDGLLKTVAVHNAFVVDRSAVLVPPRSAEPRPPMPILRPPFYAVPLAAGITYTTGGIRIDGQARVLSVSGAPIPGRYAAGSTTGGHEGGPFATYTGGLGKALTFGWIAGSSLASFLRGINKPVGQAPPIQGARNATGS
jgi:fumarate reductase flavoprotein subunit